MKTKFFSLLMLTAIVFCTQVAHAKVRRIGYWGTPIAGTDYTTLQPAHDASARGDTILLFPGSYAANFTKKLVVIGYGYYVAGTGSNANLQAITGPLTVNQITLSTGSDSAVFEGVDYLTLTAQPGTPLKNILINRCNVLLRYTNAQLTSWKITQSNIVNIVGVFGAGAIFNNLTIENSIIRSFDLRATSASSTGALNNNIFINSANGPVFDFQSGSYVITNSIFTGTFSVVNTSQCFFQNDIATGNKIPAGNGNIPNVDISTLFVGFPTQGVYSNDSALALRRPGSPAIGAGIDGTDCGIFGGSSPYHLSGIPSIPSFYKITSPSPIVTTNPFTITFSVRSNN
ncbi:MAG: hypothetical protein ABI707_19215 [Ferruginibacter sp.]